MGETENLEPSSSLISRLRLRIPELGACQWQRILAMLDSMLGFLARLLEHEESHTCGIAYHLTRGYRTVLGVVTILMDLELARRCWTASRSRRAGR